MKSVAILVLPAVVASCLAGTAQVETLTSAAAPDGSSYLSMTNRPDGVLKGHLVARHPPVVLSELPLDPEMKAWDPSAVESRVAWRGDSSAVAVGLASGDACALYALVHENRRGWQAMDLTDVSSQQLGKLGRPASDFARCRHVPMQWVPSSAGRMLRVESQYWDRKGQRFSVVEAVLIGADGSVAVR